MVGAARLPDAPGIRLTVAELMALRDEARGPGRHRPATRRQGAVPARLAGAGIDLREIRAYVPGDDPRRLDPAATARTGQPHIRSLHEDRDDTTLLVADFRRPMLWGTGAALRSVRAARHLARSGWQAVLRGGSVAGLAVSDAGLAEMRASTGDAQMAALARLLAHQHDRALRHAAAQPGIMADARPEPMPEAPPDRLVEALAHAARLAPAGGRVILATAPGAWLAACDALARLARRRSVSVVLMLDEVECASPSGLLAVSDGRHSRLARLSLPDLAADTARLQALGVTPAEARP
ncbi:DUF58 domain-containing protein [Paracoccus spongiarum]|uniref:DUF58 domain-containing protein n=1 Tax=Paracoccus spongiarum TaxID=3064387 RepID=A0ABT9J9X5_9RHOB|nr:DUF58 domain-containing protein [Paracoccus sp. 2205BS29-5]MDP5306611.1 DUF58 domain-containing protein [Paracoccus sp. 2205BS29-5]